LDAALRPLRNSGAETVKHGATNGLNRLARGARGLVLRFAEGTRGNVAMMFALALPVLLMISLGAVDIHQASKVKANLQDALDAAALAAARTNYTDDDNLNRVGLAALKANMPAYFKEGSEDTASFTLNDNKIIADARVNVKVLVANIVLPPYGKLMDDYLPVGSTSEVLRASRDIEVGLVLDVTGSMAGSRIANLKDAARELVKIVVQDEDKQTPFYSRMAIIPYSSGVNLNASASGLGDYRTLARGTPPPSRRITGAAWSSGSQITISGVTKASPGVVTANGHGLKNGDFVWVRDVSGMTQLNDRAYRVASSATNTLRLESFNGSSWSTVNTSGYSTFKSGSGKLQKCLVSDCSVVVTAAGHGLSATDADTGTPGTVYIRNVGGMTQINDKGFEIANVTSNSFSIGVNGASYGAYTSGGEAFCGYDGCAYRVYRNVSGNVLSYPLSDCVTERTGANYNTDVSASASNVGRLYPSGSGDNICTKSPILPLTADRDAMYNLIGVSSQTKSGLQAGGFTAGQIGLAWGWYAVSPEFASFWPTAPADYNPQRTLKAVVLMTDGEFNMSHCSGVMARNAGTTNADRIACDAARDSYTQARALCTAIKGQDIVIYTVGFQVSATSTAGRFLESCASGKERFHTATSSAALTEAFKAIGRDITRLRIAR
jgi:Flp pilus assembly protein TadG